MKQIEINGHIYFFLLVFLGSYCINLASADTNIANLPPVKQGDCFLVQETCGNCTYVNITSVKYPNETILALNYIMSSIGGTSWYNNSFCDSNATGNYIFDVKGNPNGIVDSELIQIYVNPTGIESNGTRTTILTVAIIAMLTVSILFFFAFMYFKHPTAKLSFVVMSAIFFLVGINLILNSLTNEVVDPNITALFDFISAASYYFYWFGGGMICVILFLTAFTSLQDRIKNKKLGTYGGEATNGKY